MPPRHQHPQSAPLLRRHRRRRAVRRRHQRRVVVGSPAAPVRRRRRVGPGTSSRTTTPLRRVERRAALRVWSRYSSIRVWRRLRSGGGRRRVGGGRARRRHPAATAASAPPAAVTSTPPDPAAGRCRQSRSRCRRHGSTLCLRRSTPHSGPASGRCTPRGTSGGTASLHHLAPGDVSDRWRTRARCRPARGLAYTRVGSRAIAAAPTPRGGPTSAPATAARPQLRQQSEESLHRLILGKPRRARRRGATRRRRRRRRGGGNPAPHPCTARVVSPSSSSPSTTAARFPNGPSGRSRAMPR